MLAYLILRFRVAKVQAELLAQVNNQRVVNQLCQKPESIRLIDFLFKNAYYRNRKDASFLIVCALMIMIINEPEIFSIPEREFGFMVLGARLARMRKDREYCIRNFMIIADCEEALDLWEKSKTRV